MIPDINSWLDHLFGRAFSLRRQSLSDGNGLSLLDLLLCDYFSSILLSPELDERNLIKKYAINLIKRVQKAVKTASLFFNLRKLVITLTSFVSDFYGPNQVTHVKPQQTPFHIQVDNAGF